MNKRIISAVIIIVAIGTLIFSTKEERTEMKLVEENINWGWQINRVLEKNSQDLVIKKDEQSIEKEADKEMDAEQVIQEIVYEENETESEEEPV
ncbi:MAG: hypothetical protein IJP31_05040 [Lachnospiraceae bacterium]|nr:hypothetical protein [Lachnospiraceae bacterium]